MSNTPDSIFTSNNPVDYVLNGQAFSATSTASLSNTNETNIILFSVPSNALISARALMTYGATDATQGIVTMRFYSNPTVTNNGTSANAVIVNNYIGGVSNQDTQINLYSSPQTSDRGMKRITMVYCANTTPQITEFKQTAILAPGSSLLMTLQASNLGLLASINFHFFLEWVEV